MQHAERPILSLGHSPDADDAFMWWPIAAVDGRPPSIDSGGFQFRAVTDDIESLNQRSSTGELDITAMSCANYPFVADQYAITACGASVGDRYGPRLVARARVTVEALRESQSTIAIPGLRTSAFGALMLMLGRGSFSYDVVPFQDIIPRVVAGEFDAGVVIHEGQLTYGEHGLHEIEDLGRWWFGESGLPLPLGINAIRRDLDARFGEGSLVEIATTLHQSVEYALAHRDESLNYAMTFAPDISRSLTDEFVGLYVNGWTLDFGETGRSAAREFLNRLALADLCPEAGEIDFVQHLDSAGAR